MRNKRHKQKPIPPFSASKFLNVEELSLFCDYLEGRRAGIDGKTLNQQSVEVKMISLICEILLTTGLRACELCGLKVLDTPVVREEPEIFVDRGSYRKNRKVPISEQLAVRIDRYCENTRPLMVPSHLYKTNTDEYLFFNRKEKQFSSSELNSIIKRMGKRSGLGGWVTATTLRYTFAVYAYYVCREEIGRLACLCGYQSHALTEKFLGDVKNGGPKPEQLEPGLYHELASAIEKENRRIGESLDRNSRLFRGDF